MCDFWERKKGGTFVHLEKPCFYIDANIDLQLYWLGELFLLMLKLAYNIILALGIVYLLLTWALGSSIKDLRAAASKNDVRL